MKFGVVVFPGSNCDHDAFYAVGSVLHQPVEFLWHQSEDLRDCDAIILPGGFAYGDYLRTGAIASFSPIMGAVRKFAEAGGPVVGICNGFQVLLETGLLPGAMLRNSGLRFICRHVHIRVETTSTPCTANTMVGQVLTIPIAHSEGNYFCDPETLAALEREDRVVFRYVTPEGIVSPEANPNGSLASIAGICNSQRNVVGLMPHPERAVEPALGSADGLVIFQSLAASLVPHAGVSS